MTAELRDELEDMNADQQELNQKIQNVTSKLGTKTNE